MMDHEVEHDDPLSTVFEEDRAAAAYLLENGTTPEGSTHAIIRKSNAKGNTIRVDMHYAFFEHGGRSYAYCNYFDITGMKENEQRNQAMYDELNNEIQTLSGDRLAVIRSNLEDGVVIGDAAAISKGSIFPKQRSGRYMDYITEQVLPAAYSDVHDREKLMHFLSPETVAAALEDQESYSVDVTCEIDGEIFYKRFMFYAVDASVNFYVLLKSDYTAMQAARNEQLKTALEEARQANVAKTAFLSNMSHEIRTPMNAIIGLDNIALNEDDLSPKTREHLEQIGVSTRQLLGLIKDILDMSRIESGRIVLSAESVATFEDKSTLRFTVSDTGIGIDRNYLPRLFEAFSQENIANTSRYGGLGLGLALTKNIVEIMNGSITVESEKHKGPSCCSRRRQHL